PWGGVQGTAEDISRQTNEILRLREKVNEILSKHTSKSIEKLRTDTDRDYFMSAFEAQDYGIVDEVIMPTNHEKK
ncbi:MAG: ATP-dependent Clp protease proteolytic subunit, partial [Candidatus Omnitrophica bacterium]|nr:ATP-dependent Clp protease proteolytic subunit [Candidatus Omnitrophota bacterium]